MFEERGAGWDCCKEEGEDEEGRVAAKTSCKKWRLVFSGRINVSIRAPCSVVIELEISAEPPLWLYQRDHDVRRAGKCLRVIS